jgi:S1-C subfamily serine protease
VPMSDLLPLLPRLKQGDKLAAGLLGIGYDATDAINGSPVIKTVRAESPAAVAGLQSGDRIVTVDGRPAERIADIRHALTPRLAGDTVTLVVRRGTEEAAEEVTVTATLVDRLPPLEANHARPGAGPPRVPWPRPCGHA